MYENSLLCKKCGGRCCNTLPGSAFPIDFGITDASSSTNLLKECLTSGRWCVDWWEGDPTGEGLSRAYFIRPVIEGCEGRLKHPTWGGKCTFLGVTGCELTSDKRPLECKMLEPKEDECVMHRGYDKENAAIAWIPYTDVIEKIIDELED
jgi:Fe-S-cluster containining protein